MADLDSNPAVLRRRLRTTLQTARIEKEMTQAEAARHLGWSPSKLLRIENGKHGVSSDDLGALLALYGITDPEKTRDLWSAAKGAGYHVRVPDLPHLRVVRGHHQTVRAGAHSRAPADT